MGTKQTEKYAEAAGQIAPYDPQARAGTLAEYMSSVHIYRIDELPRIELYLDQVITLVCDELAFMCLPDEQTLTGSMVNNYVKQRLVCAPKRAGTWRACCSSAPSSVCTRLLSLSESWV